MIYVVRFYSQTYVLEGAEGLDLVKMWDQFKRDFDGAVGPFMMEPVESGLAYYEKREATIAAWCERWGQIPVPTELLRNLLMCFLEMIRVVCQCQPVSHRVLNVI